MKKFLPRLILICTILGASLVANAQQLPLYSEYMFNTLEINPAYAGFRESVQISSMFRKQWTGFKSAPQSAFVSVDFPIPSKRIGLGVKIVDDRDEITKTFGAQTTYSFKIPVGDGSNVSLGLQAGLLNFKTDYTQVDVIDPDDPSFSQNINTLKVNFGTGVFFHTENFYIGLSSPNLIRNNFRQNGNTGNMGDMRQNMHLYFNTGYVLYASDNLLFKPSILVRGVVGSPLTVDINANFWLADMVGFGMSYRNKSAMVGIIDLKVLPELHVGYAYDHSISKLNIISKGSHELVLRYEIPFGQMFLSPRYF